MLNTTQASNAILVLVLKYNKNTSNGDKHEVFKSFKLLHRQFKNTVDLLRELFTFMDRNVDISVILIEKPAKAHFRSRSAQTSKLTFFAIEQ